MSRRNHRAFDVSAQSGSGIGIEHCTEYVRMMGELDCHVPYPHITTPTSDDHTRS